MIQVVNVPLKVFLKLTNECELANQRMNQLKDDMSNCFNLEQNVCDCSEDGHKTTKRTLNLIKFSDVITKFNKELIIKPKYNSHVDQYLNYSMNIDVKVYINMIEAIHKFNERVLYHENLVNVEDKEKYAYGVVYGNVK